MTKKRKIIDGIYNFITYLASSVSILLLVIIFSFILIKGKDSLSLDMIRNDYWSQNYLVNFSDDKGKLYTIDYELKVNQAFSKHYGIVLEDNMNHEQEEQVIVTQILEDSPFTKTMDASSGEGNPMIISIGDQIEKLVLVNGDGSESSLGMIYSHSAQEIVAAMDSSVSIKSMYYQSPGGGIWGSLLATLQLIALSLLFALPLGIFTAIYLNEIANKGMVASAIEASIDLLAGVPSIVFGLMGVIVLYPITSLFKIQGLSILLGSLTMAVVLLPVIIRSVQESLKVVPDGLRMASLSLGASKTQTIFKIILPSAMSGILSAILLAISRIIGESAALIYTMGTFINDSPKISEGATSLAVHIWSIMSQEQPNFELASAISIIILAIVFILNISVKLFSRRLDRKLGH